MQDHRNGSGVAYAEDERNVVLTPQQPYRVAEVVVYHAALAVDDIRGLCWDTFPGVSRDEFAAMRSILDDCERILEALEFGTPWHPVTVRLPVARLLNIANELLTLVGDSDDDDVDFRAINADAAFAIFDQLEVA